MNRFRVFLGAPSKADLQQTVGTYNWQTISSTTPAASQSSFIVFPPATLDAASHRISLFYQNVIFEEDEEERSEVEENEVGLDTTTITWPPTAAEHEIQYNSLPPDPPLVSTSMSVNHVRSFNETYETQDAQSYNYSDASSITRFPSFHINLHTLTALSSLSSLKGSRKVNVLLAVLEVEGPDTIRIKKGVDAGKEVSLLKMILGDEDGSICKLTAWREVAESWGGGGPAPGAKRGDILLITNVSATTTPATTPTLTASPYLNPTMTICYRTMPYTHQDQRLRPDLRLGKSDVGVRKVGAVVEWFERMAGLEGG